MLNVPREQPVPEKIVDAFGVGRKGKEYLFLNGTVRRSLHVWKSLVFWQGVSRTSTR